MLVTTAVSQLEISRLEIDAPLNMADMLGTPPVSQLEISPLKIDAPRNMVHWRGRMAREKM